MGAINRVNVVLLMVAAAAAVGGATAYMETWMTYQFAGTLNRLTPGGGGTAVGGFLLTLDLTLLQVQYMVVVDSGDAVASVTLNGPALCDAAAPFNTSACVATVGPVLYTLATGALASPALVVGAQSVTVDDVLMIVGGEAYVDVTLATGAHAVGRYRHYLVDMDAGTNLVRLAVLSTGGSDPNGFAVLQLSTLPTATTVSYQVFHAMPQAGPVVLMCGTSTTVLGTTAGGASVIGTVALDRATANATLFALARSHGCTVAVMPMDSADAELTGTTLVLAPFQAIVASGGGVGGVGVGGVGVGGGGGGGAATPDVHATIVLDRASKTATVGVRHLLSAAVVTGILRWPLNPAAASGQRDVATATACNLATVGGPAGARTLAPTTVCHLTETMIAALASGGLWLEVDTADGIARSAVVVPGDAVAAVPGGVPEWVFWAVFTAMFLLLIVPSLFLGVHILWRRGYFSNWYCGPARL